MQRQMLTGERMEDYYFDKLELCDKYDSNMAEADKIAYIRNGLPPYIIDRLSTMKDTTSTRDLMGKLKKICDGAQLANARMKSQTVTAAAVRYERESSENRRRETSEERSNGGYKRFTRDMRNSLPKNGRGHFRRNNYRGTNRFINRSKSRNREDGNCYYCGNFGHFARNCRKRNRSNSRNRNFNRRVSFQEN